MERQTNGEFSDIDLGCLLIFSSTYVGLLETRNLSAFGNEKSCFDGELFIGLIEA